MNSVYAIRVVGFNRHEGEDFTIELKTCIVGHSSGPKQRSFSFELNELVEEDESWDKEELNYSLIESGVDDDSAQMIMMNLVLSAADARSKIDPSIRGVLTLSLFVHIGLVEHDDRRIQEAVRESFDGTEIRFRPASRLSIASLSRKGFKKQRRGDEKCTICLEDLVFGVKVASLPCVHQFHDDCIVEWLETCHVCPLCRFELPCEPEPVASTDGETQTQS